MSKTLERYLAFL